MVKCLCLIKHEKDESGCQMKFRNLQSVALCRIGSGKDIEKLYVRPGMMERHESFVRFLMPTISYLDSIALFRIKKHPRPERSSVRANWCDDPFVAIGKRCYNENKQNPIWINHRNKEFSEVPVGIFSCFSACSF